MITCQACKTVQLNGTLFCTECGTELSGPAFSAGPSRSGDKHAGPSPNFTPPGGLSATLPKLVRSSNTNKRRLTSSSMRTPGVRPGTKPSISTSPIGHPVAPAISLKILVLNSGRLIDTPNQETVIIGRSDTVTGDTPDIDLTPDNAAELGVSRRHASFSQQDGKFFLSDLGSTNKTFLNRQPLLRGTPYELGDGDEIRLGNIVLKVIFSTMG